MIKRIFSGKYSRLKKTIAAFAFLLFVFYLVIVSLITSNTFSHWIVNKGKAFVPALTISHLDGNFFSGVKVDGTYSSQDISISFEGLNTAINSSCIWSLTVCVDFLKANEILIVLQSQSEPKNKEPIKLPDITIPIDVVVDELSIKKLIIEQAYKDSVSRDNTSLYQAADITGKLKVHNSTVSIERFSARDDFCNWQMKAKITLHKNYPLTSSVNCKSVASFGDVAVKLSGNVAALNAKINTTLNLNQITSQNNLADSPVMSTIVVQLKPLEENLPIIIDMDLTEPLRIHINPHYVDIVNTKIHVDGFALTPSITLDAKLSSDINPEATRITSNAHFNNNILQLDFLTFDFPEGEMTTAGSLNIAEGVEWLGNTRWKEVGLEQWQIIPSSEWTAGRLSGSIDADIQYKNEKLKADVNIDRIVGEVNQQPLMGNGSIVVNDNNLTVRSFNLNYAGDNKVIVSGELNANTTALNIDFNLANADPFIKNLGADISGRLSGKASLKGQTNSPNINVNALLEKINYNRIRIDRSTALIDWGNNSEKTNTVKLKAEGIRLNDGMPTNASIVLTGTLKDHGLFVDWEEPEYKKENAQLRCSGKFPSQNTTLPYDRWVGVCDDLNIEYDWQNEQQRWALTDAIEIDYSAQPLEISFSTFCLKNKNSKICNEEFLTYREGDIASLSVSGEKLPLNWAKPFMPENMRLKGDWEFVLQGDNVISENNITAEIMASDAHILWLTEKGIQAKQLSDSEIMENYINSLQGGKGKGKIQSQIKANKIFAQWHWNGINDSKSQANVKTEKGHRITWEIDTEKNGDVLGHLSIIDNSLEGELIAQKVQLENVSNIAVPNPEDIVTGEVSGQLTLTGSLDLPVFNGQLALADGYVESAMTPMPIKNIAMNLDVKNNVASLDGKFDVNEGEGFVKGEIDWKVDTWSGNLDVIADEIAFQPEPKMLLYISPDLRLLMSPEELSLSGVVTIPKARVEVEELPESAIVESRDAVIVGEEVKSPQQIINTSLQLVFGDDVRFKGFGLETNIKGDLTIQQTNNELLKANGILALHKGRYKAYGQNLLIQEGDLVFVGNIENPQLRVSAIRAGIADDVTVGLLATGAITNPQISLFSQPVMSQQAQLSYLLTGNAPGTETETDPALAAKEAALSYALASDVGLGFTKKAGEALGIEDLQLTAGSSPNGGSESGTQIGVSGYVTPKLMVRYGVGVFDAFNSLTLNYRLSKNLYLEVISGESSALDLLWSFERD